MSDAFDHGVDGGAADVTVVDLLLGEGSPAAQQALRARIAEDPVQTLEMAETVALLEQFRQLRVEPSPNLACRLLDVERRALRRTPPPQRTHWLVGVTCAAAAAVLVFALLWEWDPLHRRAALRSAPGARIDAAPAGVQRFGDPTVAAGAGDRAIDGPAGNRSDENREARPPLRDAADVAWETALETMRSRLSLESSRRLEQAFEVALLPASDPLQRWLDPQNALASLRADHELRAQPEVRRALLRLQGSMVAVDARVQALADGIAAELLQRCGEPQHGDPARDGSAAADLGTVALAVRALIAAGAVDEQRSLALRCGGEWLAARLPDSSGARLVSALAPLVELAAVSGRYGEVVAQHGVRLVDEVLRTDADIWGRRLPDLLSGTVPVATLGDAARLLRLLPGVGVDPAHCHIVRQLLLGRLRERRDAGDDGPGLLAAMLYGGADLMAATERDEVERQLRRWSPLRLAPDFLTVQQLAWGFEPGRFGFTRLQRELRRLAVLPDPDRLGVRAAFCLCLATGYAAWPSGVQSSGHTGE